MTKITTLSPIIWVLPAYAFRASTPTEVEPLIRDSFQCDTWLLDDGRALAFSFRELLTDRGIPVDNPLFEKLTMPIFRFLDQFLVEDQDALDLKVPDIRFWPRIALPPGETEKRYCMY